MVGRELQYLIVEEPAMVRAADQMPPGEAQAPELTMMFLTERSHRTEKETP